MTEPAPDALAALHDRLMSLRDGLRQRLAAAETVLAGLDGDA